MKEEMDYLAHQRLLKDKSMRRKRVPKTLPTAKKPPMRKKPPVPTKGKTDPVTGEPTLEDFDMVGYMKRQRLAKEKAMLEGRELEDPNYKPLSPTAHRPVSVPDKDRKKLEDAAEKKKRQGKDEDAKEPSLFDQINKERLLRERQLREADPTYKPLSPTGPPKKGKGKTPASKQPEAKEDTLFEQM